MERYNLDINVEDLLEELIMISNKKTDSCYNNIQIIKKGEDYYLIKIKNKDNKVIIPKKKNKIDIFKLMIDEDTLINLNKLGNFFIYREIDVAFRNATGMELDKMLQVFECTAFDSEETNYVVHDGVKNIF